MSKILIADDDDIVRRVIRISLENKGYEVFEAKDGNSALEIFQEMTPKLVVLDIHMGDKTGIEVCQAIRQDPYGKFVPVIFLTALGREEDILNGFREGADDYIRKPFSVKEFQARVEAQLARLQRHPLPSPTGEEEITIGAIVHGENAKYQIDSQIADGGMGVIYHGFRIKDKLPVAIKTLNSRFIEAHKDVQRFLREARCALKIDHPNLAMGLDLVYNENYCFYVMEYIEGINLEHILTSGETLEESLSLHLLKQVTKSIDYLHTMGLVHRDIKPGNIIIKDNAQAVLVDMGLAKITDNQYNLTTKGIILGTPYYMSPEQAMGEDIDIRSDIYSLGATWYHLLTGNVPFTGHSTMAIIQARFHRSPALKDMEQMSPKISSIIQKMLARLPEDRYQTPGELLESMEAVTA